MIAPAVAERANQRAGLLAVHRRSASASSGAGSLSCGSGVTAREIDRLAADHADRARRARRSISMTRSLRATSAGSDAARLARQHVKRLGQQPVARQDRHPFAGDDVQRRPAAAHRVVVHGRQIVVNQRVGVDQLDRARGGHRQRAVAADRVGAGQAEHRPQPLAAGREAVAHRVGDDGRAVGRRRQERRERGFDFGAARVEIRAASASSSPSRPSTSSSTSSVAGAGLSCAALVEDLDAPLGLLEPGVAEAGQLHAALVELQRRFERQVAFFELLDDRLELGDRGFEVLDR